MIEIDGSKYEGGGAILRVAIALSAITKKPCYIFNIRKKRKKPGLMLQHLKGIKAVALLADGYLEGDRVGSDQIKFYPQEITPKDLNIKIETAGSITLCLQSIIPVAIFAKRPINIFFEGGGTDVPFSPTIDYYKEVFLKILEKIGIKTEIKIIKRGYFPDGGGRVEIKIFPSQIKQIEFTKRGRLEKILIFSGASLSLKEKKVAERQIFGAREILKKLNLPIEEKVEYYPTSCLGSNITLVAIFENTIIGTDNLGKLGKKAEDVGKEAVLELLKEEGSKAALDKHLADQILIYMALSGKKSEVSVSEITTHCQTNIWVIEKFLEGYFKIQKNIISWIPK